MKKVCQLDRVFMNCKLDQADRAPGKLWRKVHNLAMAISFWEKKKKKNDGYHVSRAAVVTQNRGQ